MNCNDSAPDQCDKNLLCPSFLRVMSEHDNDFKGHENDEPLHHIIEGQNKAVQNHSNQRIQGIDSILSVGGFSEGNDLVPILHHVVSFDHIDSHMWEKHQPSSDATGSMLPSGFNNNVPAGNVNDNGMFDSVDAVEGADMNQMKAVILSHPLYQKLLEAHFSCLKVFKCGINHVELTTHTLSCPDSLSTRKSDADRIPCCKKCAKEMQCKYG